MRHIILIGFMGAGKSSIGKALAENTGLKFVDTDAYIEKHQNMTISRIFEERGEAFFRDLETRTLQELAQKEEALVIAVGGGLPVREENRRLLKEMGEVIYLRASLDTLEKRLRGDTERPKLQGGDLRERIRSLMEQREELYQEAATAEIPTDGKKIEEVAKEIETYVL